MPITARFGSLRTRTGGVAGTQGTDAFGEPWYSGTATTEFVYTSYQYDQESALYYAMARYYDPTLGRFCSADPVGGDPGDPQTWNRYPYSRNDPINLTDPSGKSFWSWLAKIFEIVAISAVAEAFSPMVWSWMIGADVPNWAAANFVIAKGIAIAGSVAAGGANLTASFGQSVTYTFHVTVWDTAEYTGSPWGSSIGGGAWWADLAGAGAATGTQVFQSALNDLQKRKLNSTKCQTDLNKLGTNADAVRAGASSAEVMNGVGSTRPFAELYLHAASSAVRQDAAQGFPAGTVGDLLARPGVNAASELGGNDIYMNPSNFNPANYYRNMASAMHEVLHNVTGLTDPDIQHTLGLKEQQNDTSNITDRLYQDCF
jgi:RHS repeat-associated protein